LSRHPLHPTTDDVVQRLHGSKNWSAETQLVDDALHRRDLEWLADLHAALLPWSGVDHFPESSFSRSVLNGLALTPGLDAAQIAMALCRTQPDQIRSAASWLAFVHPADILLRALDAAQPPDDDLLACWVHEHLLRKGDLPLGPPIRDLQQRLIAADHPLAALPLRIHALETRLIEWMPQYCRPGAASWGSPYLRDPASTPLPEGLEMGAQLRRAKGPFQEQARAAIAGWLSASNGKALAGLFVTRRSTLDRSGLQATGYACFPDREAHFTSAQDAFDQLFAAASNGGAYGGAMRAAHGRLAAWQSMAALVGCDAITDLRAVEARAAMCTWATFRSAWHHDIAWDLGIAVLRPSGHLAVLAATDTD
jgi:hypothetical protein